MIVVKNQREKAELLFEEIAAFSSTKTGVTRLPFTAENKGFIEYLKGRLNSLGKRVWIDEYGNIISVGNPLSSKTVFASHYDSVPGGGKYDGVAGIVFGLLLLESLKGTEAFDALEIAAFNCEESSRFGSASLGSKGFLKMLDSELNLISQLEPGKTFGTLVEEADYAAMSQVESPCSERFLRFIEVHIDQSAELIYRCADVALIKNVAGHNRLRLSFNGCTGHSGLLDRNLRKDSLLPAAGTVLKVKELADKYNSTGTTGTVTRIENSPNVMNMISGATQLYVDIRGVDGVVIDEFTAKLVGSADILSSKEGISMVHEQISRNEPVAMDIAFMEKLDAAMAECAMDYVVTNSSAWHDIAELSSSYPANLIFIANPSGKSHCVDEGIDLEAMIRLVGFFESFLSGGKYAVNKECNPS